MPTSIITIKRVTGFRVTTDYEEGHVCTADEAMVLHRARCKALANNFGPDLLTMLAAGTSHDDIKAEFRRLDDRYTFEGKYVAKMLPKSDPIVTEALRIAKSLVRDDLKSKGASRQAVSLEDIEVRAKDLIDRNPKIMAEARRRYEVMQDCAIEALNL